MTSSSTMRLTAARALGPRRLDTRGRPPTDGVPLPEHVRRAAEALFETDLSAVRVHAWPGAPRPRALACTSGPRIFFAPGAYAPDTGAGLRLLGHELAHVIQQRCGRAHNPLGYGLLTVRDAALEREADRMGALLAARVQAARGAVVQRMESQYVIVVDESGAPIDVEMNGSSQRWVVEGEKADPPVYTVQRRKDAYTLRFWDGSALDKLVAEVRRETVVEARATATLPEFELTLKGNLQTVMRRKFTGFEGTNKGDGHFEKHGKEFALDSKQEYIRAAKQFGEDTRGQYMDFAVQNSFVRCDLTDRDKRRVFAANGKQIRTFYVWNKKFSRDPFAYAIAFTVDLLPGTRLEWSAALREKGVDLTEAFLELGRGL